MNAAEKLRTIIDMTPSLEMVSQQIGMSSEEIEKFITLANVKEEELLMSNMRLIYSIARSFLGKGMDFDDLVYEGMRGFRKALTKFDHEKGYAFSTYAYPWIKDYMRSALAAAPPITLPRHVYKLVVKVNAIRNRFQRAIGYSPSDEELASALGISAERFEVVRRALALVNRNSDATADEQEGTKPTPSPYDESTWERTESFVGGEVEGRRTEQVESREPQPQAAAGFREVQQSMQSILQLLPAEESAAVLKKLGLGGAYNDGTAEEEGEERALYRRGLRRLRKLLLDPSVSSDIAVDAEGRVVIA